MISFIKLRAKSLNHSLNQEKKFKVKINYQLKLKMMMEPQENQEWI